MGEIVHMPPRGHYLAQEVGELAGVSGETVGQWARYGYIRASWSKPGEYPRIYSFQDIAEAIMVHELVDQRVPLKVLRPVIESLRDQLGDWPLQHAHLETLAPKGIQVAALLVKHGVDRYELGDHGWQQVGSTTVDPRRVAADLNRGGWAARQIPDLRHIEVDPDRLSGRPTIRGRRVPASMVAELAEAPHGVPLLHEDYDLDADQIRDARRWWEATRRYERAAA